MLLGLTLLLLTGSELLLALFPLVSLTAELICCLTKSMASDFDRGLTPDPGRTS